MPEEVAAETEEKRVSSEELEGILSALNDDSPVAIQVLLSEEDEMRASI